MSEPPHRRAVHDASGHDELNHGESGHSGAHAPVEPEELRFCPVCAGQLRADGRHPVCTECGRVLWRDPKVGVGVVVHDEADRLLLVQRGAGQGRGLWALPAGFLDADEDPRAAAARETLEETGLVVEVGAVVDAYAAGTGTTFFLAFLARVVGGTLHAGDDAVDARFFAADELPPLAFPSTVAAAAGLRANRGSRTAGL